MRLRGSTTRNVRRMKSCGRLTHSKTDWLTNPMDRARTKSKTPQIKRVAIIAAVVVALISGVVTLANIDFSSHRVDRTKISIETVRLGTMEIKVGANGQLLSKHIEQLPAQAPGRVPRGEIKPGPVGRGGQ